jgi:hypothetical protein
VARRRRRRERGEAALALAEQPGNQVTLSYRKDAFFRLREKTETRLPRAVRRRTHPHPALEPRARDPRGRRRPGDLEGGSRARGSCRTSDVFVMAGGVAPFALLEQTGSLVRPGAASGGDADSASRAAALVRALAVGLLLSVLALSWALWKRGLLRARVECASACTRSTASAAGLGTGLALGILAAALSRGT